MFFIVKPCVLFFLSGYSVCNTKRMFICLFSGNREDRVLMPNVLTFTLAGITMATIPTFANPYESFRQNGGTVLNSISYNTQLTPDYTKWHMQRQENFWKKKKLPSYCPCTTKGDLYQARCLRPFPFGQATILLFQISFFLAFPNRLFFPLDLFSNL